MGDHDGTLVLLDPANGRRIARPYETGLTAEIESLAFSPDGSRLVVTGRDAGEGFVRLFDGQSFRHIARLGVAAFNNASVPRTAFSPDGSVIAATAVDSNATRLLRWDTRTGDPLSEAIMPRRPLPVLFEFVSAGRVLTVAEDGTMVREAATLRPLRRLDDAAATGALSQAAGLVALGEDDGSIRLLDVRTGALRTAAGRHEGPVVAMRFSPGGERLVTAGEDGRLIVWDPRRAAAIETLPARGIGQVQGLDLTDGGGTAYSAGRDGTVIAWDLTGRRRWERRFAVRGNPSPRLSLLSTTADGSQIAVVVAGGYVDLFDGRTLRRIGRFEASRWRVAGAALSSDGRTLAMTTLGGTVELWDTFTRRRLAEPELAHAYAADSVTFSGDGRWLATGDAVAVRLWDVQRRTSAGSFVQGDGSDLSLSPDGKVLAVTARNDRFSGGLEIRSVPSLDVVRTVPVPAGTAGRFAPDGRTFIYGDRDGRIWTLDTRTWKPTGRPFGEGASIRQLSVSADGRLLATTASDDTGRLWDLTSRRPIGAALSGGSGELRAAGFIGDGAELAVIHEREGVAWDVRPDAWVRHACAVAGRTLTRGEWTSLLPDRDYDPAC